MASNSTRLRRDVSDQLARRGHGKHGPREINNLVLELARTTHWAHMSTAERVQVTVDAWELRRAESGSSTRPPTVAGQSGVTAPPDWARGDWPTIFGTAPAGYVRLNAVVADNSDRVDYFGGVIPDVLAPALAVAVSGVLLQWGGGTVVFEVADAVPLQVSNLGEFDQLIQGLAGDLLPVQPVKTTAGIWRVVEALLGLDDAGRLTKLGGGSIGQDRWVIGPDGTLEQAWAEISAGDIRRGRGTYTLMVDPDAGFDDPFDEVGQAVMNGIANMRPDGAWPGDGDFSVRVKTVVTDAADDYIEETW